MRQNLYFSDFFQVKPNYEHCKEDSTRCAIVHDIAALEHKFPVCVIRRRYRERKIVQTAVFPEIFATGI